MLKSILILNVITLFLSCGSILKNDNPGPSKNSTSNISAKFNTTSWSGTWCTSLLANLGNTQVLTINGQISEKVNTDAVAIGISSFTGIGTYAYGGTSDKVTFTLRYNGKTYGLKKLSTGGGGGKGTIKITEFIKANGILNPGKTVGEFTGTIADLNSNDELTINMGKFNSVIVL